MAGISVSDEAVSKLVQACDELISHLHKISGDVDGLASASDSGGWGLSPDGKKIQQKLHEYTTSGCNADGLKKSAEEQIKTIESYKRLLKGGVEKLSSHDEESGKSIDKTVDGDAAKKAESTEKSVNPSGKAQSGSEGGGSGSGGSGSGSGGGAGGGMQGMQQAAQSGMQGAQQAMQAGMQGMQQAAQAGMQGAQQAMQAGMQGLGGDHGGKDGEHGGTGDHGGKDGEHGGHGGRDDDSDGAAGPSRAGDIAEGLHDDGPKHDGPPPHAGTAPQGGLSPDGPGAHGSAVSPTHAPPGAGPAGAAVPMGVLAADTSSGGVSHEELSAERPQGIMMQQQNVSHEAAHLSQPLGERLVNNVTSAGSSQGDGSVMGQDFQAQTEVPQGNRNSGARPSEDQGGRS